MIKKTEEEMKMDVHYRKAISFLRATTVAKNLGVHPKTIYRSIQSGKLKAYKIGRMVKIDPEDLEEFMRTRIIPPKIKNNG